MFGMQDLGYTICEDAIVRKLHLLMEHDLAFV